MTLTAIPTADGIAVAALLPTRTEQTRVLGKLAAMARRHGHAVELVQGLRGPVLYLARREATLAAQRSVGKKKNGLAKRLVDVRLKMG